MKINVIVHANTSQEKIVTSDDGTLHVYVREPARENRANQAVTKALAKHYDIPPSAVELVRGGKEREKVFEVKNEVSR